jgi:hypothetical protein
MIFRRQQLRDLLTSSSSYRTPRHAAASYNLWVRAGILLLSTAIAPTLAADPLPDTSRSSTEPTPLADIGEFYDDPDADYSDDGSRTLKLSEGGTTSEALTPISPLEETGLLGNWGDSLDEAED